MEAQRRQSMFHRIEPWIALALCIAVLVAGVLQHLVPNRPTYTKIFAPDWIHLAAVALSVAGIVQWSDRLRWTRIRMKLLWPGLLLMLWVANGLPFDLFRLAGLIPLPVDWTGLITRTFALAAAVVLAHLALSRSAVSTSTPVTGWYGYAAFVFAMPYPVMRVHWAFGGTLGLGWPGAGGKGFAPLLITIPFLLAAALSLLLVSPRRWMPRWILLTAGWTATAILAMIGPAACWALINAVLSGRNISIPGMAFWVPCLFYGSWLLLAICIGAATRSYQLRTIAR